MTNPGKTTIALLGAAMLIASLSACEKKTDAQGPAEKAGQQLDQATARAGAELSKAAEKAGESLQRLGEKLQDKAQDAQQKEPQKEQTGNGS